MNVSEEKVYYTTIANKNYYEGISVLDFDGKPNFGEKMIKQHFSPPFSPMILIEHQHPRNSKNTLSKTLFYHTF